MLSYCFETLKDYISNLHNQTSMGKIDQNLAYYQFDDDFVTIINTLSSVIKDYFKSNKNSLLSMRNSSEIVI